VQFDVFHRITYKYLFILYLFSANNFSKLCGFPGHVAHTADRKKNGGKWCSEWGELKW
jgi:hypothetical protein